MGYKCCVPGCTVGCISNPKPKDVYLFSFPNVHRFNEPSFIFKKLCQTIFMQVFVFSAPNVQIWNIHPNPPKFRRFENIFTFLKSPHHYAPNYPPFTVISYISPRLVNFFFIHYNFSLMACPTAGEIFGSHPYSCSNTRFFIIK